METIKPENNTHEQNLLGAVAHFLGLFSGFLGPLIMLLVVKDEVGKKHVKNALNWQFSLLI